MTTQTHRLTNGMVMTMVTVESLDEIDSRFHRLIVQAPELRDIVTTTGMAPALKLFVPRAPDYPVTLPGLDSNNLADSGWESDPKRPILRTYTASEFDRKVGRIACDVLDLGLPGSWLYRVAVGDRIGLIGFKNELQVPSTHTKIVAIGDLSARPSIDSIKSNAPVGVTVSAFVEQQERPWGDIAAEADASPVDTTIWIGAEVSEVARLRREALAAGFATEQILALPYWARGRTRDEFDHDLYRRYRKAAEAGRDISDPNVAADIELN